MLKGRRKLALRAAVQLLFLFCFPGASDPQEVQFSAGTVCKSTKRQSRRRVPPAHIPFPLWGPEWIPLPKSAVFLCIPPSAKVDT